MVACPAYPRPGGSIVKTCWLLSPLLLIVVAVLRADGPADNQPDNVRRVPPPGIPLPEADRTELQSATEELGREIEALRQALKSKPALAELLPDVQIYHNAVRYALTFD